MTQREKIREILDNCSFDIGGCGVGVNIDRATDQIISLVISSLPEEDCPIILNMDKRLKCEGCNFMAMNANHCNDYGKNKCLSEIKEKWGE